MWAAKKYVRQKELRNSANLFLHIIKPHDNGTGILFEYTNTYKNSLYSLWQYFWSIVKNKFINVQILGCNTIKLNEILTSNIIQIMIIT